MSRTNGYGNYRSTLSEAMAAYDAAPPLLRHAMQMAVGKWAAQPLIDAWRAGIPERRLIATIAREDRFDTALTYGRTHPEAAIDR